MKSQFSFSTLCATLLITLSVGCGKQEAPTSATGKKPSATAAGTRPTSAVPNVKEVIEIGGALVQTEHSAFDIGRIQDLFDKNKDSIARTQDATTMLVDLTFPAPRKMSGLDVTTGSMNVGLKVTLTEAGKNEPTVFSKSFAQLPPDPTVTLDFGGALSVKRARIEIANLDGGDGHVHVREVSFR